jgi:hypothetical protein
LSAISRAGEAVALGYQTTISSARSWRVSARVADWKPTVLSAANALAARQVSSRVLKAVFNGVVVLERARA